MGYVLLSPPVLYLLAEFRRASLKPLPTVYQRCKITCHFAEGGVIQSSSKRWFVQHAVCWWNFCCTCCWEQELCKWQKRAPGVGTVEPLAVLCELLEMDELQLKGPGKDWKPQGLVLPVCKRSKQSRAVWYLEPTAFCLPFLSSPGYFQLPVPAAPASSGPCSVGRGWGFTIAPFFRSSLQISVLTRA